MNSKAKTNKRIYWQRLEKEARETVDSLDHPIDSEILPVIVGLWANGISTMASCEGHLRWGRPYPWVTIEVETPKSWGAWDSWKKDERKRKIICKRNLANSSKALVLLERFYKRRNPAFRYQLILSDINFLWGHAELVSMASPLITGSPAVRKRNLKRAQAEMLAFANFLRNQFFKNSKG